MNKVSFGPHSFLDLDFVDDVALLTELHELLVPALETMASEPASLGLKLNWQKIKVQVLGSREDEPSTITVLGRRLQWLKSLTIWAPLSTQSSPYIFRRNAITHAAMHNLIDNQIWKSRISISTKLKLYNTCILPIFLYGSEYWAVTKREDWCPRSLVFAKVIRNQMVHVPPWNQKSTMCGMMTWDGQLGNHTCRLLSKHSVSPCSATLYECQTKQMPRRFNSFPSENWGRPPGCSRSRTMWIKSIQYWTWNPTTCPWMKQLTWLRIIHCGDCLRLALRTPGDASCACHKRRGRRGQSYTLVAKIYSVLTR